MIQYILCDVEGTTTSISFVHDKLFPYARKHLRDFVLENQSDEAVQRCVEMTKETVREEEGREIDLNGAIDQLIAWTDADRKHPALKELQGLIWRNGYESGGFQGHIYEDVVPAMECWRRGGKMMGIYSSGSVEAQKLLFGYSDQGDLNGYFAHNFDTRVGHKRERPSYLRIAEQVGLRPEEILFLSDVVEELDAAQAAGMRTTQLVRPGTPPGDRHPTAVDFHHVEI